MTTLFDSPTQPVAVAHRAEAVTRPWWPPVLVVVLAAVAGVVGTLGVQEWTAPAAAPSPPAASAPSPPPPAEQQPEAVPLRLPPEDAPGRDGALGVADGAVPDGVTVFDDEYPAIAHLDPELLGALREAAAAAADDGVEVTVNSGWRSREYQEHLLDEAIATYGSEEAAARWVATPDTSVHVSGDAVDIGPAAATAWLSEHGAEHGLCQIYENEPWHYELRPGAGPCPARYADPTQDPRMR